ncbi:hypothetical protein [Sphingomonas sp. Leaf28]|uniref:hypothetical protein n=1 Tax=Sphingomonas sp. Leaf28 TaxID=1735695 RepID=UPI0012E0CFDA|nr:hypothetical protein [Sphingomonas sp. Leaf28]
MSATAHFLLTSLAVPRASKQSGEMENTSAAPNFADAIRKVERADQHIREFAAIADRHFARHPWQVGMVPERRRGRYAFSVGERQLFPDRTFSLIIGDAVHNLRTALDYLLSACALARGGDITKTEFPFGPNRRHVVSLLARRVRPAGPLAERLVLAARPYTRGNRLLWSLAELDRRDKHRLVVPTGCLTNVAITSGVWNALEPEMSAGKLIDGRGTRIPVPPGYEEALMVEARFEPEIIFGRGSPVARAPCVPTLKAMSRAVLEVIDSFEEAHGAIRFARQRLKTKPNAARIKVTH